MSCDAKKTTGGTTLVNSSLLGTVQLISPPRFVASIHSLDLHSFPDSHRLAEITLVHGKGHFTDQ